MLAIRSRAERLSGDQIVDSFSSVGPLSDLIEITDHQVIFGRRGTGKTHALRFLYTNVNEKGDIGVFVDMLNLGSDTSIYNDKSLSVAERATRLLIDVVSHIQEGFLDYATSGANLDFAKLTDLFGVLNDATSSIRVNGETTAAYEEVGSEGSSSSAKADFEGGSSGIRVLFGLGKSRHTEDTKKPHSPPLEQLPFPQDFPNSELPLGTLFNFSLTQESG